MYLSKPKRERSFSSEIIHIRSKEDQNVNIIPLFDGVDSHPNKLFLNGNITMGYNSVLVSTSHVNIEVYFEVHYGDEVETSKLMMMPVIMRRVNERLPYQYQIQENIYINKMRKGVPTLWNIKMIVKFESIPCDLLLNYTRAIIVMNKDYIEYGIRKYERNLLRTARKETFSMGTIEKNKVIQQKSYIHRKKYNLYRYKREFIPIMIEANNNREIPIFTVMEENTRFKNISIYLCTFTSGSVTCELYVRRNNVIPLGEIKREEYIGNISQFSFVSKERQLFKKIKTPGLVLTRGDRIVLFSSTEDIPHTEWNQIRCVVSLYHTNEVIERESNITGGIESSESYSSSTSGIRVVKV